METKHPSHDIRVSLDSYDEICENCGATDRDWGSLAQSCLKNPDTMNEWEKLVQWLNKQ